MQFESKLYKLSSLLYSAPEPLKVFQEVLGARRGSRPRNGTRIPYYDKGLQRFTGIKLRKNYLYRELDEVVGQHVVAELLGGNPNLLNDERYIVSIIKTAAERAGGTVKIGRAHV